MDPETATAVLLGYIKYGPSYLLDLAHELDRPDLASELHAVLSPLLATEEERRKMEEANVKLAACVGKIELVSNEGVGTAFARTPSGLYLTRRQWASESGSLFVAVVLLGPDGTLDKVSLPGTVHCVAAEIQDKKIANVYYTKSYDSTELFSTGDKLVGHILDRKVGLVRRGDACCLLSPCGEFWPVDAGALAQYDIGADACQPRRSVLSVVHLSDRCVVKMSAPSGWDPDLTVVIFRDGTVVQRLWNSNWLLCGEGERYLYRTDHGLRIESPTVPIQQGHHILLTGELGQVDYSAQPAWIPTAVTDELIVLFHSKKRSVAHLYYGHLGTGIYSMGDVYTLDRVYRADAETGTTGYDHCSSSAEEYPQLMRRSDASRHFINYR